MTRKERRERAEASSCGCMDSACETCYPEDLACDFCDGPWDEKTGRAFKAVDFVSHVTMGISEGGWAACPECAKLVEAKDWPALAKRSADLFVAKYGPYVIPREAVEQTMLALHDEFRRAML